MNFRPSREQVELLEDLRAFLGESLPDGWDLDLDDELNRPDTWEFYRAWQKRLAERSWLALGWPVEWGGLGVSSLTNALAVEEMAYSRAPYYNQGVDRIGPTIMRFGTDEQKAKFLPPIASGETVWCQGFSEPESGSDLASLSAKAEVVSGGFRVSGTKVWTSYAHRADWMALLVRTDAGGHKTHGISYLLVDLRNEGIQANPLIDMADQHTFNEMHLEDLFVPEGHLLGGLHEGWKVTTATLGFERSGIGRLSSGRRSLIDAMALARRIEGHGRPELAALYADFEVARLFCYRAASAVVESEGAPPAASIARLFVAELLQRSATTLVALAEALPWGPEVEHLRQRSTHELLVGVPHTIAAGTSEVQRNIIARMLGLPRGG